MKIAVLLSGGVDSSVALSLLKLKGYDITAFYLKIWLEDELSYLSECPWQEDLFYVQTVCKDLNVKLEILSLQKEYYNEIIKYTLNEIKNGRTPNPDIMCNNRIKFGVFYKYIKDEFDYIATGHYAKKIVDQNNRVKLLRSKDAIKDQTYFLSNLTIQQLKKALFPIEDLEKHEVRKLADKFDLATKKRKDSQGICFLGKLKFNEFIKYHFNDQEGDLIEYETNKIVGSHNGYWYFTIGQRKGIKLPQGPWYVVKKDIEKNIVYISRNYFLLNKERNELSICETNWFNESPKENQEYLIKLRHGAEFNIAYITEIKNGIITIKLKNKDQGISSGQFAVIYNNLECLGSGRIV
jgi:tRNA (5-methylaminomethyl-2-thiouridylate)-methyltransferase